MRIESIKYSIYPVGVVRKDASGVYIEVFDDYIEALVGVAGFSHIEVYFWFDQNDFPEKRNIMKVHPRGDTTNPLTGVFATHSPVRPNLIGRTVCKIVSLSENLIFIDDIDAFEGTPVIDIKCHIPKSLDEPISTPEWAKPRNA